MLIIISPPPLLCSALWSQWTVKFEFCGAAAGGQQEVAVSHLV